jgi:hypothetical protein
VVLVAKDSEILQDIQWSKEVSGCRGASFPDHIGADSYQSSMQGCLRDLDGGKKTGTAVKGTA